MFVLYFVVQLIICFLELFNITDMAWYVQLIPTWIFLAFVMVWVIGIGIIIVGCIILAVKGDDFFDILEKRLSKKLKK